MEMTTEERNVIVEDNLKLVDWVLNNKFNIHAGNQNYDDFRQEGVLGLMYAVDTWKESVSQFSTYATNCIIFKVIEARRKSRFIGIPRSMIGYATKAMGMFNDGDSTKDIAKALGIGEDTVKCMISISCPVNLDTEIADTDGLTVGELIPDPSATGFEARIADEDFINTAVNSVIKSFRMEWHREFIREYFDNLIHDEAAELDWYAAKYGRTKQQCSSIILRAKYLLKCMYINTPH